MSNIPRSGGENRPSWEQRRREIFEREKTCYEQNYQQFRSLNQTMWQVPIMAMTLTGGLWFAITTVRVMEVARAPLLMLAGIFDVAFVLVLVRVRYVMGEYLNRIRAFHPQGFTEAPGDRWYNRPKTVVRAFSLALGLSGICSFAGAIYFAAQTDWGFLTMMAKTVESDRIGCTVAVYDREARELARAYESVSFDELYKDIIDLLPKRPSRVLDVGAGSGRDAAALYSLGHNVTAVEPSRGMREAAKEFHPGAPITWIADCLPALPSLRDRGMRFDVILVSAVWMHLSTDQRDPAAKRLTELLAPSGLLIITLRHGPPDEARSIADIPDDELIAMMGTQGLTLTRKLMQQDRMGRSEIEWSTLVFRKPS